MNVLYVGLVLVVLAFSTSSMADCQEPSQQEGIDSGPECAQLEHITIFGAAQSARDVAGGASVITPDDLVEFATTDIVRALPFQNRPMLRGRAARGASQHNRPSVHPAIKAPQ